MPRPEFNCETGLLKELFGLSQIAFDVEFETDFRLETTVRMVTGGYAGTGYWSPWYLVLGPLVPGSGWREGGTDHISKT